MRDCDAMLARLFAGTDGNDSLTGTSSNDSVFGGLGSDSLTGGGGNDRISCGHRRAGIHPDGGGPFVAGMDADDRTVDVVVGPCDRGAWRCRKIPVGEEQQSEQHTAGEKKVSNEGHLFHRNPGPHIGTRINHAVRRNHKTITKIRERLYRRPENTANPELS